MTSLGSILKIKEITLPTNVCLVKAVVFPVVMYGCESWTLKKAEHQRIEAFELWCWRRLLRVPWTARRLNLIFRKWVLNIHCKDWCWSWNCHTLATWCEELTHWKRPCCWERLKAGGEGDSREWDGWMASPTRWTGFWVCSGNWWWTGKPGMLQSMGSQRAGHKCVTELNWISRERQNGWTVYLQTEDTPHRLHKNSYVDMDQKKCDFTDLAQECSHGNPWTV